MNYLSGDNNKSILGKRLSSRYLSSDAFTSSAGKMSGRSISKLGSLFGRGGSSRRFSGTGQRAGLFEFKNIFLTCVFVLACIIVIGYTIPFTRYSMHRFFIKHLVIDSGYPVQGKDILQEGEYYVAPVFGKTDRFVISTTGIQGELVYTPTKDTLLGILEVSTSSKTQVVLLSEVGQKNNLFIATSVPDIELHDTRTASGTEEVADTTSIEGRTEFRSAVFEGFGYGQLRAQIPPQEHIEMGTVLYARTQHGLVQVARVNYFEKDTGSTFTNIYAQLLVPPFNIYKVYISNR